MSGTISRTGSSGVFDDRDLAMEIEGLEREHSGRPDLSDFAEQFSAAIEQRYKQDG